MVSNNFMEIRMDGGGGSLNLEILRGGGLKQFLKFKWKGGGGQETVPSFGEGGVDFFWNFNPLSLNM